MKGIALVKLGGSVITFKEKPLSANLKAIDNIVKALARIRRPLVIVHGGGSFGHYWSVEYDMHTKPDRYDPRGIAVVHESMIALNQIIVGSMLRRGMNPYGIAPSLLLYGGRPSRPRIKQLKDVVGVRITPVTFGDIIHIRGRKYSILSGDSLMSILSGVLKPSKVVFATNVDGIYRNFEKKELIKEISIRPRAVRMTEEMDFIGIKADVTGGMRRKVIEAFKIASSGIDVLILNGLKPDRIASAIIDNGYSVGTKLSSRRIKN